MIIIGRLPSPKHFGQKMKCEDRHIEENNSNSPTLHIQYSLHKMTILKNWINLRQKLPLNWTKCKKLNTFINIAENNGYD
jgi:hypothetical protein